MVYWNVLYHSDYENINIMLIKAENGGFPPTSRRYMQEWALEELAMLAQIPEGSPREFTISSVNSSMILIRGQQVVHQAMVQHDIRPDTCPIWKDLYTRATRLGWYLMRFGV
ncbi:hypothetical protein HDK64DRAFT_313385 [Phyllosticta capitalensis]